jgi:hypothetical protein
MFTITLRAVQDLELQLSGDEFKSREDLIYAIANAYNYSCRKDPQSSPVVTEPPLPAINTADTRFLSSDALHAEFTKLEEALNDRLRSTLVDKKIKPELVEPMLTYLIDHEDILLKLSNNDALFLEKQKVWDTPGLTKSQKFKYMKMQVLAILKAVRLDFDAPGDADDSEAEDRPSFAAWFSEQRFFDRFISKAGRDHPRGNFPVKEPWAGKAISKQSYHAKASGGAGAAASSSSVISAEPTTQEKFTKKEQEQQGKGNANNVTQITKINL